MEQLPPPFNVSLSHKGTRAIIHINNINCQSDGEAARWIEDKEESSEQAKQFWLVRLGCLLKIHKDIECQLSYSSTEPNTKILLPPATLDNPWMHKIADFPQNYKLFAVKRRQTGRGSSPREDHYLCGVFFFLFSTHNLINPFFLGGPHKFRSPQEFYPHMHWLIDNTQGVRKKCICQYCDSSRTQKEINKIFPLPPCKTSPKGPTGPKKHQETRKLQAPRGVTTQRVMVRNRNSITTGPVSTLEHGRQKQRIVGFQRDDPFQL